MEPKRAEAAIAVERGEGVRIVLRGELGAGLAGALEHTALPRLLAREPIVVDLRACTRVLPEAAARILFLRSEAKRLQTPLRVVAGEAAKRDLARLRRASPLGVEPGPPAAAEARRGEVS